METIKETLKAVALEIGSWFLILIICAIIFGASLVNAQDVKGVVVYPLVETHIQADEGKPEVTKMNCIGTRPGVLVCTNNG